MGSGQAAPVAQRQQHTCIHHPPALVTTSDCLWTYNARPRSMHMHACGRAPCIKIYRHTFHLVLTANSRWDQHTVRPRLVQQRHERACESSRSCIHFSTCWVVHGHRRWLCYLLPSPRHAICFYGASQASNETGIVENCHFCFLWLLYLSKLHIETKISVSEYVVPQWLFSNIETDDLE